MEWWKKLFAIIAGSIGWSSVELLMAWIFDVPVEMTLFCGFVARVSFGEVFARNFTEKNEFGKRLRLHLGADFLLLPQGFLIMMPSALTLSVALGGLLIGSYLVWKEQIDDRIETIKLKLLVDDSNTRVARQEDSRELKIRVRVAELDAELEPREQERSKLKKELEKLEQKKGYRGP